MALVNNIEKAADQTNQVIEIVKTLEAPGNLKRASERKLRQVLSTYAEAITELSKTGKIVQGVSNRFDELDITTLDDQLYKVEIDAASDALSQRKENAMYAGMVFNEQLDLKKQLLLDTYTQTTRQLREAAIFIEQILLQVKLDNNTIKQMYSDRVKKDKTRYNGAEQVKREYDRVAVEIQALAQFNLEGIQALDDAFNQL